MNERLRVNIGMLMIECHERIKKLRTLVKGPELEAILSDRSLKWVRSKKCPQNRAAAFAEAIGFIHGGARALGICELGLVTQLLDKDENEDAEVLGTVAKYAVAFRPNSEK